MSEASNGQENLTQAEQEAEFLRYFSKATIKEVRADEVPLDVMECFDSDVVRRGKPHKNIGKSFIIRHSDEDITYLCEVEIEKEGTRLDKFRYFFVDTINGVLVGYGEMTPYEYSLNHINPHVGYTETFEGFKRQGLGRWRLIMMNALSESRFGMPLRSADMGDTSPEETRIWERLVQEGRAKKIKEGVFDRYVMIDMPVIEADQ